MNDSTGSRQRPFCPGGTVYTIRSGDTLSSLASRFNTTVDAIIRVNPGIVPTNLQVGQQVCIPGSGSGYGPGPGSGSGSGHGPGSGYGPGHGTGPSPRCPRGTFSYTIRHGDTYHSLARRFNTSGRAIREVNPGIDPRNLYVGQNICIPEYR